MRIWFAAATAVMLAAACFADIHGSSCEVAASSVADLRSVMQAAHEMGPSWREYHGTLCAAMDALVAVAGAQGCGTGGFPSDAAMDAAGWRSKSDIR